MVSATARTLYNWQGSKRRAHAPIRPLLRVIWLSRKLVVALLSRHGRCAPGEGGDAICSFNPVYAQGMTVAAMDASALRDALQGGDQDLRRRFFATVAKGIGQAWQIAVGSDLALPEVERTRTVSMRLANVYTEWALAATESNRYVAGQFWKVMNTVDVQTRLHRPSVMLRVAITNVRRSLRRERRMRCSVMLGRADWLRATCCRLATSGPPASRRCTGRNF